MDINTATHPGQAEGHTHGHYSINIAEGGLQFRQLVLTDPIPMGRQILAISGLTPVGEYSLLAILPSGDFEDVRLDETYDLQASGAERFIAFRTDRTFKFTIDDKQMEWGKPIISGQELHKLAKPAEGYAVFLEVRGGEDRLIEREDLIDLNEPGIEHFITAPKPEKEFVIVINGRRYTIDYKTISFEQVLALAGMIPNPEIIYLMTFTHAASKPHKGTLTEGNAVKVKQEGTVFNVTATVRS
ncbi:MAG: hypothetical protein EOP52_13895 [Sphingobacteriales bacterium]|nr:MAG: hypothetical protein EOP52_13895 [Sphingobacteriales bacterium]